MESLRSLQVWITGSSFSNSVQWKRDRKKDNFPLLPFQSQFTICITLSQYDVNTASWKKRILHIPSKQQNGKRWNRKVITSEWSKTLETHQHPQSLIISKLLLMSIASLHHWEERNLPEATLLGKKKELSYMQPTHSTKKPGYWFVNQFSTGTVMWGYFICVFFYTSIIHFISI